MVVLVLLGTLVCASGQKYLPDDPIKKDYDDLPIEKPARVELSPTFDMFENSFGDEGGPLVRAENINTLGEVPDSSWFTNRIGVRDMTLEELVRGNETVGPRDTSAPLTVLRGGLGAISSGLVVRDQRGELYYLVFDRKGFKNMGTGAAVVASKFFHAFGYNVPGATIAYVAPAKFEIEQGAKILQLGSGEVDLDREFIDLLLDEMEPGDDGLYRAVAYSLLNREPVGEFKFFGTRSDDPNDIFPHENRRELRGLRIFSAWLNHTLARAINTRDFLVTENGRSFIRHYLVDFSTALGSGWDLNDRLIPKDKLTGNEHVLLGDTGATLKTAATFGIWTRPWLEIDYPYPEYAEIGRIEGDHFEPDEWKPEYPNPAFSRMLPDDAFWAAKIVARFSDEMIRAIVKTGQFSDPAAEEYLVQTLIKRRDKIVEYYFRDINPLDEFRVENRQLVFANLGEDWGLASGTKYEHEWFVFDNQTEELQVLTQRLLRGERRINIPKTSTDYLTARIRSRSVEQRQWKKNIDVTLRMDDPPVVVGVEREVGAFVLERTLEGGYTTQSHLEFGGTYQGLEDDQQRLIDEYVRRLNELTSRDVKPDVLYDNLALSARTTFEGVTHALSETQLSDENGEYLGTALDIIDQIETVRGRVQGAGGDQQFRMYVTLKPDALEKLDASQEFMRKGDNTHYHKGYPLNYRQLGGPPSAQVSIARDGRRADIDVDYRASGVPSALFNGHLTAANSDVRAGNNHSRHVSRWEGYTNWWRGLFGLPAIATLVGQLDPEATLIPVNPRKGKKELPEAVEDFLEAWFVEERPEQALAYMAPSAYACLDLWQDAGEVDYGMAPLVLLDRMAAVNEAIGRVKNIENISVGKDLSDSRLVRVEHKKDHMFRIYDVPENLAHEFDCSRRNDPEGEEPGEASEKLGKYFFSVFDLEVPGDRAGALGLMWTKQDGYWRIVSYVFEPEGSHLELPDISAPVVTIQMVEGDPGFVSANDKFRQAWRTGNIDSAASFFTSASYPCLAYFAEGERPQTDSEIRERLHTALSAIIEKIRSAPDPSSVVKAVDIVSPEVRQVKQPEGQVFTIGSLPDHLGEQFLCENLDEENDALVPDSPVYGNYYAVSFQLDLEGDDPAILDFMWAREGGEWKIVALRVARP
jgi:hypothetical protein